MSKNKFLNVFLGLFLGGMVLFSGCKKDDETPRSNFTYNGETYDLSQGLIFSDTVVPGQVYMHYVMVFSDGFTIHLNADKPQLVDSISGRGEALIFAMFSDSPDGPADGTYNHLPSDKSALDAPDVFTWAGGAIYIDYSETEDSHVGDMYDMVNGTIEVKNTGTDKYEFKLNITSEEDKTLTGYINLQLTSIIIERKKSFHPGSFLR